MLKMAQYHNIRTYNAVINSDGRYHQVSLGSNLTGSNQSAANPNNHDGIFKILNGIVLESFGHNYFFTLPKRTDLNKYTIIIVLHEFCKRWLSSNGLWCDGNNNSKSHETKLI